MTLSDTKLYNNTQLCSYIFASDSFDKAKNIFYGFLPLIEAAIKECGYQKPISFLNLQQTINDIYGVNIPKATVRRLLEVLEEERKIKFEKKKRIIVDEAKLDDNFWKDREFHEKEINDLFLSFREFLLKRNIKVTYEKAKESICKYIFTHCFELADFIGGFKKLIHIESEKELYIYELCDFLFECREKHTDNYTAIVKLYKGAVQSTLLNFNPDKIQLFQDDNLLVEQIILDTNFVMRILDIQTENECIMAQETFQTLKKIGVKFTIFPQTIEEIVNSIKSYLSDSEPYNYHTGNYYRNKKIKMSGIIAAVQRGKSRSELLYLSKYSTLKEKLVNDLDIETIEVDESINLSKFDIESLIHTKDREGYGLKQARHDLTLIAYCRDKRDRSVNNFVEAKWWVLTNDVKLTYWNQKNCSNVQECITEAQLSNLLWLKSKKEENSGLANTMVAIANSEIIDQQTLFQFINRVQSFKLGHRNDKPMIDKISLVFASDSITTKDLLRYNNEESEIEQLINEKIMQINKEQENKKIAYNQSENENANLQEKLHLSELKNELLTLDNGKMRNHSKINEMQTTKEDLINERQKIIFLQNFVVGSRKKITKIVICCASVLISLSGFFIWKFISVLLHKIGLTDLISNIANVTTIVGYVAGTIRLVVIKLIPDNLITQGYFQYFVNKKAQKYMKENNISFNGSLEDYQKNIEMEIESIKEELITLTEQKQSIQFQIDQKNKELEGVTNISALV